MTKIAFNSGIAFIAFISSWLIMQLLGKESYVNYVLMQNAATAIYLLFNMGVNIVSLDAANNRNSFSFLAPILFFAIISAIINYLYFLQLSMLSLTVYLFSNLLFLQGFLLNYELSMGRFYLGNFRYSLLFKLGIIVASIIAYYGDMGLFILLSIFISILLIDIILQFKDKGFLRRDDSKESMQFVFSHKFVWLSNLLYGIFAPGLVLLSEKYGIDTVATIGVAVLIAQPARLVYQTLCQSKLPLFKESLKDNGREHIADLISAYRGISILSGALIAIGFFFIVFFEGLIIEIFPVISPNLYGVIVLFYTFVLINSVWGPNGLLLNVFKRARIDALIVALKVVMVFSVLLFTNDVLLTSMTVLVIEILLNLVKNTYINLRLKICLPIYMPLLISGLLLSLIVTRY